MMQLDSYFSNGWKPTNQLLCFWRLPGSNHTPRTGQGRRKYGDGGADQRARSEKTKGEHGDLDGWVDSKPYVSTKCIMKMHQENFLKYNTFTTSW